MNSNMITNKKVSKIKQFILYLNFSWSEFIDTVLPTFVDILFALFVCIGFVTFVDTLSVAFIIYHTQLLKYQQYLLLLFSQIHVLGFQL